MVVKIAAILITVLEAVRVQAKVAVVVICDNLASNVLIYHEFIFYSVIIQSQQSTSLSCDGNAGFKLYLNKNCLSRFPDLYTVHAFIVLVANANLAVGIKVEGVF